MRKKILVPFLATLVLVFVHLTQAQQIKVYRVGVIHEGGPYSVVVDGLKDGLKELGLAEGKHYVLEIRDLKGDRKAAEAAAMSLEREKVDLVFVVATSLAIVAKRVTAEVPIVFDVGSDPVVSGLVESLARPGGRLTGVHWRSDDLTPKRLEILREMLPQLRRAVMFYDPGNAAALAGAKSARDAARQLNIELVERQVASADELRQGVKALKAEEADALLMSTDAMVVSQAQFIIDAARDKKLPAMFPEQGLVAQGALVSYGVSYYKAGRLSAKYVQRILTGASPQNLPVESLSRMELAVNLKTARELGLTIPQSVLLRAEEVIE